MELDEFWEQSDSTRSLWHIEHFMRWVVSCTKTNFSEVVHHLHFSKNNFPLLKARPNFYLFTADLVFSLKAQVVLPPFILNERPPEPTFDATGQRRSYLRFSALLNWSHSCVHPSTKVTYAQAVRFHSCALEPRRWVVTEPGNLSPIYNPGLPQSAWVITMVPH